ncbi:NifU family protein [Pseudonocardia nematodicida]|uniref:NifU family protein n=1 Tax=Pseudonocardia nematodicida TaxID=1206997 RepID=A0ABV1K8X2_9PSEU
MAAELDPATVATRIEAVLDGLDEAARPAAEELVGLLMRFYGAGLDQLVTVVRAGAGDQLIHRMAADPLVGGLLALHDLHPVELRTRVGHAVEGAKRSLGGHGDDVELLGIDPDGTVRIGLTGAGCGSATIREVVSDAVTGAAPDAAGVAFVSEPALLRIGIRTSS